MNLTEKIVGEITGEFIIESYQRGYRWSEDEIVHLLEDINETCDGQNYCLQPIVVKNKNGVYGDGFDYSYGENKDHWQIAQDEDGIDTEDLVIWPIEKIKDIVKRDKEVGD